ncbi:hypothetical protein P4V43_13125 [Brevibacillus fortis]|nr:hypothetical protein [Brevibacillus fortis]
MGDTSLQYLTQTFILHEMVPVRRYSSQTKEMNMKQDSRWL